MMKREREESLVFRYLPLTLVLALTAAAHATEYAWQEPQAEVTETGAIQWKPKPFIDDLSRQDVRYIDYENGDDDNDGRSTARPWKHHPWDYRATNNSATCSGVKTYVFKRGVFYRGQLNAKDSGTAKQPIRLTSTAKWGDGEAVFVGSVRLPAKWVRADDASVTPPRRLPDLEKVWVLDLEATDWWNRGRPGFNASSTSNYELNRTFVRVPFLGLFVVEEDGSSRWCHLARDPDWQPAGNEFAHDYWHAWDRNSRPFEDEAGNVVLQSGAQDDDLKGYPQDYFTGAIIWSTYPSLMGGATPKQPLPEKVTNKKTGHSSFAYNPDEGSLAIMNFHGFSKGTRYKIENLPQHLDTVDEFYLQTDDKDSALLYYRPADGVSPNDLQLELTVNRGHIHLADRSHIEISGLGFRYADGESIAIKGECESITVHHRPSLSFRAPDADRDLQRSQTRPGEMERAAQPRRLEAGEAGQAGHRRQHIQRYLGYDH
jgi:hypothetical protein